MGEGMRRIFAAMKSRDFVAPHLESQRASFSITLRHESVFSEQDQRWLDAFSNFDLARDEAKVILLGRHQDWITPRQIFQALDLIDTEDYREIVYRLQSKGLLIGKPRAAVKKWKAGQRRDMPRYKVRDPADADRFYADLLRAFVAIGDSRIGRPELDAVKRQLADDSPYSAGSLPSSVRSLGLIDDESNPAGRLKALLVQGRARGPRT